MKKILLLVSVFVLGLTLSACNPTETDKPDECPAGQELKDGNCVTVDPVCTGDEVLIGGECVLDELTCDAPYVPVFGQCVLPYDELDRDVVGRIDLMLWSGSGTYWADMGKQDLTTECAPDAPIDCVPDLTAQNDAAAYAVAKAFNAIYPNVVINVKAYSAGPNDNGQIWSQELINYKNTYGAHPSVWASTDLPGEVAQGLIADLSQFSNDPMYLSMNPSILEMMNYNGFQAGLPQYILPWGIYVNKELAILNGIDVPGADWTIDEYTDFIANHIEDKFYGSMDTPIRIIETGTDDIVKSLFNYSGSGSFVDLNSDQVKALVPYIAKWDTHSRYGNEPTVEFVNANGGGWAYPWFKNGSLLTLEADPWMMGDCATPDTDWELKCVSSDWDIYPRPSTDYVDNTIGIVLDPMAVYNFCLVDDNLACTEQELLDIKISYTFASFWIADTRSWEARAAQEFWGTDSKSTSSALNDSFPVTTGDIFARQMQIWYRPSKHIRFSDASIMPGFHEVVRIYESGQFWDISDKSFPYFHSIDGSRRSNLYEWQNYWNVDINGGVEKSEPDFTDTILNNLYQWNIDTNDRFAEAYEELKTGLKTYYGYTEADFQ